MSKKETIEDRVRSLEAKEQKIKLQLDSSSGEMKDKAKQVGKVALIAGVVAILGYWVYNIIFQDDDVEDQPKKKKKKSRQSSGFTERLTALAMPYLNKALDGILDDENENEKKEGEE